MCNNLVMLLVALPVMAGWNAAQPPVCGQQPAETPPKKKTGRQRGADECRPQPTSEARGEDGDKAERPFGRGRFWMGRNLFPLRPVPGDQGPLREGEREELIRFAEENAPAAYEVLNRLRDENPEAFEKRFLDVVPKLRALRRVFETDSELGKIIVQHSQNEMAIRQGVGLWRRADSEERERMKREWRRRLASNARLEVRAAQRRLQRVESDREQWIAKELAALLEEGADLAAEPPKVRGLVESIHAAADDVERQECAGQLYAVLSLRFDDEVAALRERLADFKENAPEEVDRRLQRLIERAERPRRDSRHQHP
ncbi:MAG: hypothetical protein KKB50_21070 [Planctomycetes bacterium]|nr:hypothetical protein [Planctomycetota bacterium]